MARKQSYLVHTQLPNKFGGGKREQQKALGVESYSLRSDGRQCKEFIRAQHRAVVGGFPTKADAGLGPAKSSRPPPDLYRSPEGEELGYHVHVQTEFVARAGDCEPRRGNGNPGPVYT